MKVKKLFRAAALLVLSLIHLSIASAQAPDWKWVKAAKTKKEIWAKMATDANGNTYLAGYFHADTFAFDRDTIFNTDPLPYHTNVFLAKYDSSGNVIWTRTAKGGYRNFINGISLDALGNIYVCGSLEDTFISFSQVNLSIKKSKYGYRDFNTFLVKYSPDGNVIWAKSASAYEGYLAPSEMGIDKSANLYIVGHFFGDSILFGSLKLHNSYQGPAQNDMFIVKYDSSGKALWASQVGGYGNEIGINVVPDNIGNMIVTGAFSSDTISIGKFRFSNIKHTPYDETHFMAKYTPAGKVTWVKTIRGDDFDQSVTLVCDKLGNIYVQGIMQSSSLDFDNITLTRNSDQDIFLAKYNKNGKALWAKNTASDTLSIARGLAIDNKGSLYSTGTYFGSYIYLGKDTLYNTNPGKMNMFIQNFDSAGNVLWEKNIGGTGDEYGWAVSCDPNGHVYVAGTMQNSRVDFGSETLQAMGKDSSLLFLGRLEDKKVITSLEGEVKTEGINIFPNPSDGKYTLTCGDGKVKVLGYDLYNATGNKVSSSNINTSSTIDISDKPAGIYFLHVHSEKENTSFKLIKY